MQMRALIAFLAVFLCTSCTRSCSREESNFRERKAVISDEDYDFEIYQRYIGYGHHDILADVARSTTTHFWVEIEQRNRSSGATKLLRTDLYEQLGVSAKSYPFFWAPPKNIPFGAMNQITLQSI